MSPYSAEKATGTPQRPMLHLSRRRGKKKLPPAKSSKEAAASSSATTQRKHQRRRPRERYDSPPIPSSFVAYNEDAELAQLEKEFFAEDDDDTKTKSKSKRKREFEASPKTALDETASTPKQASLWNNDDSSDDDEEELFKPAFTMRKPEPKKEKSAPNNRGDEKKAQAVTERKETRRKESESNTATLEITVDEQRMLDVATECFQSSDPTVTSTKDIVALVSTKLGGVSIDQDQKERIKEHLRKLMLESKQPKVAALDAVIDQVFASIVADGVENCSVKQFLQATQDNFDVPFSKATKKTVKKRVTQLLLNHDANEKRAANVVAVAAKENDGVSIDTAAKPKSSNGSSNANADDDDASVAMRQQKKDSAISAQSSCAKTGDQQQLESIAEEDGVVEANVDETQAVDPKKSQLRSRRAASLSKTTSNKAKEAAVALSRPNKEQIESTAAVADGSVAENDTVEANEPKPKRVGRRRRPKEPPKVNKEDIDGSPPPKKKAATKTQGRKRTRACNLCSKCPCTLKARESSGSTSSLDFAQSDAAIEKALIKRLLKLEAITDQYDEQTEAVRRQLKKHRRDMWKKREATIKKYDDLAAKRKAGETSRFLPDVDELDEQFDKLTRTTKRQRTQVAKAQENLFAVKPVVQPTLTQMMGVSKDNANDTAAISDEKEVEPTETCANEVADSKAVEQSNGVPERKGAYSDEDSNDEDEESSIDSPIRARRVDSTDFTGAKLSEANMTDGNDAVGHTSIWDAVRSGKFDSSCWDSLFHENADDTGVDHLLGLLCDACEDDEMLPHSNQDTFALSQSSLSTTGRTLAEEMTERILMDPIKRQSIERVCPNWKENVVFAMGQKEASDVSEALINVQESKAQLQRAKAAILESIKQQEAALGVFEEILQQSSTRFAASARQASNEDGFILSQQEASTCNENLEMPFPPTRKSGEGSRHSPLSNRPQSIDSEIGTIIPSPMKCTRKSLDANTIGTATGKEIKVLANADEKPAGLVAMCLPPGGTPCRDNELNVQCRLNLQPNTPLTEASRDSRAIAS